MSSTIRRFENAVHMLVQGAISEEEGNVSEVEMIEELVKALRRVAAAGEAMLTEEPSGVVE